MVIGSPKEVSGCFLTSLKSADFASEFSKAQNNSPRAIKDTTIRAVMLSGNKCCAENSSQRQFRKPGASYPTRSAVTEAFQIKWSTLIGSRQRQTVLTAISLGIERHDGHFAHRRVRRHLDLEISIRTDNRFASSRNRDRRARRA